MKKALVIANMLFASSTVFGMFNNPDDQSTSSGSRKRNISQIGSEESSSRKRICKNSEDSNCSLQKDLLSFINSKNQATELILWAAKSNQQGIIDYLIENNVDVNSTINGQNSLYQAVFNKNLELADHLILNGAKFNENDKENLLFNAIYANNLENVKYLIGKGVNIGYKSGCESFLDRAVSKKYFDIAKYLIENGAEVSRLPKSQVLSIAMEDNDLDFIKHLISSNYVSVNYMDTNKRTLLHNAVISNKFDIVKYLVNVKGININAQDNNSYTPLLYAAEKKQTNMAKFLIKKLVEEDNTGNALNITGGRFQKTPLYEASSNGSLDIVKLLVRKGADFNKGASNDISPTEIAILNDHIDIVKYLIEHGVNVNETDSNGMSLLSLAIVTNSENSVDLVNYLIEKGAKINRQSIDGWTPLHEAVQAGNKEIVQILLDHDAFVNAADTNGWTPLHEASQNGNLGISKLLADNGADAYASCSNKSTPASIASNKRFADIVKYLSSDLQYYRFTSNRLAVHNK